eukprot:CAMPEP_0197045396 /NCGR_PEP_ID=MMETSP1384-20130603/21260_1 /TAXON_ID=29189 /ORGANISM="Ammonia sp." /LENGTH=346 /DNA_ID=CAMNT_0042477005 /DNA_START=187 /DNA_END=1227 /DNA_ORIENTATION=+
MSKTSAAKTLPYHLRQFLVPEVHCPDCKQYGEVLEDRKSGQTVCRRCGLVLENQLISEETEWRSFANDDKSGPDPNRVGCVQNIYLSDMCGLETQIGTIGGSASDSSSLAKTQMIVMGESSAERKLKHGITEIEKYGARLNLTKDVKNFCCELYKELMSRSELYNKRGIFIVTACVYISCKRCHCDRSLDSLCTEFIVDKKVIRKIITVIHSLRASDKIKMPIMQRGRGYIARTTAEIIAERFAWQLNLNKNTIKHLRLITRKIASRHILEGKKPETFAAAAIYLTVMVNADDSQRRCLKEISIVAKISEFTIKKAFKEHLFLKLRSLLPDGYGDANMIAALLKQS